MRRSYYRALPLSLFELFQTADCTRTVREQGRDLTTDPDRAGGDKSVAVKHLFHQKLKKKRSQRSTVYVTDG